MTDDRTNGNGQTAAQADGPEALIAPKAEDTLLGSGGSIKEPNGNPKTYGQSLLDSGNDPPAKAQSPPGLAAVVKSGSDEALAGNKVDQPLEAAAPAETAQPPAKA